ncbi:MAG: hypothetical protein QM785_04605 [Pyrinomonadaceae bacterium]
MRLIYLFAIIAITTMISACGGGAANTSTNGAANTAKPGEQVIVLVERPQRLVDMSKARGDQDKAAPSLKIVEPAANAAIQSSTVKVKLAISGDLKGYKPGMNEETHTGNHIHVILDNQPYEAYYNLDQEFELKNVSDGEHTLRVFPSRPWHESYKNDGAFQMVKFSVKNGGAETDKPATTNTGEQMSNSNTAKPTPEAKEMKESTAGEVDPKKPLLTYSRPKGEYKGADAAEIMIDFWLLNAKLVGDGGEYKVRYTIDQDQPKFIEKWEPIWLSRWNDGKHTIKLELIDKDGNLVDNGGYNATTREINIAY